MGRVGLGQWGGQVWVSREGRSGSVERVQSRSVERAGLGQ